MKLSVGFMLGLVITLTGTANAEVAPFARVEATASFPLRAPQTTLFYPGFSGGVEGGLNFGWVDAKLTALMLALPVRPVAGSGVSVSGAFGGGLRVKVPYDKIWLSPWVDADLFYDRSSSLNRIAYSLALGFHVPVTSQPTLRLGPVVRFFQIVDTAATNFDDRNAYLLSAGLSVELDHFTPDVGEPELPAAPLPDVQPLAPPPPEPAPPPAAAPLEAVEAPPTKTAPVALPRAEPKPEPEVPPPAAVAPPPAVLDTDGDGIPDDQDACPHEAGGKHASARANGCPSVFIKEGQIVLSEHLTFASGKADIVEDEQTSTLLKGLHDIIQAHAEIKHLLVVGYTDSHGSRSKNLSLSRDRAAAVVAWLVNSGVDANRLSSDGKGPDDPIASNDTPEGRGENRRVEFRIQAE